MHLRGRLLEQTKYIKSVLYRCPSRLIPHKDRTPYNAKIKVSRTCSFHVADP